MRKNFSELIKNESGQALVFVIATMVIALSIGVGVSLRNLSSISRTSRSDTSARAQAAAEGGAENVLSRTQVELDSLAEGTSTIAPIQFTGSGDGITAAADVTVQYYNIATAGGAYLPLAIEKDQLAEVKLAAGNVITICWSSLDSAAGSDLYYLAYNDVGDIVRVGVSAGSAVGFPASYITDGFATSDAGVPPFEQCHTPTLPANALGIRIRSINAPSRLGIYEVVGTLPSQGYLITSVGRLFNVAQGVEAEAVVKVIRSAAFLPGIFDFAVFSGSDSGALD